MKTAKKGIVAPEGLEGPNGLQQIAVGKPEKKVKPKIELVSYSIKMVIPTGQYANIQPEIIVKAGTVEEAHDYIAPHMDKLWKEYYMIGDRRPEPTKTPVVPSVTQSPKGEMGPQQSPVSSVALVKATQAIDSCLSVEALQLIESQISKSVKLSHEDKFSLIKLLETKLAELNKK